MIISCPGGSGGTYIINRFREAQMTIIRPDAYVMTAEDPNESILSKTDSLYSESDLMKYAGNVSDYGSNPILIFQAWGGMGRLKGIKNVVWIIRDPCQAYGSLVKIRKEDGTPLGAHYFGSHFKDYVGYIARIDKALIDRLLTEETVRNSMDKFQRIIVNYKKTIDAWLYGPLQYYRNHVKNALEDKDGYIVRYEHLKEDFSNLPLIPGVSLLIEGWTAREKKIEFITEETQEYIYKQFEDLMTWR